MSSSNFNFTTPADLGAATQIVDGTKWDHLVESVQYGTFPHVVINKVGSTFYAQYSTGERTSSSSAYTAINTALNAVHTANSKALVLLGPHEFDFASQSLNLLAKSNVAIIGAGLDLTTILNGAITNTGTSTTSNIVLKDLTINANSNRGNAVNLQKVTDLRLQSAKLMNSSSNFVFNWTSSDRLIADKCIFVDGGLTVSADNCAGSQVKTTENESVFRNCYFEKTNSLGGGMLTTGGTGNLLIDGCQFNDPSTLSYAAVSIENSFGTCKEARIVNCRAYGNAQGFQIGNGSSNAIDRAEINGCFSTGVQKIQNATEGIISNGIIHDSVYGYYVNDNTVIKINNCIAKNTNKNGSTGSSDDDKGGLFGIDNDYLEINNFTAIEDNAAGFMPHGIRCGNTTLTDNEVYITNPILIGPFTDWALRISNSAVAKATGGKLVGTTSFSGNTVLKLNNIEGYVTEAQGISAILSPNTSVAVTHGLSYTPTPAEITINFTEIPTVTPGATVITNCTSTQFTVNVENNPSTSNLDFGWSVRRI